MQCEYNLIYVYSHFVILSKLKWDKLSRGSPKNTSFSFQIQDIQDNDQKNSCFVCKILYSFKLIYTTNSLSGPRWVTKFHHSAGTNNSFILQRYTVYFTHFKNPILRKLEYCGPIFGPSKVRATADLGSHFFW